MGEELLVELGLFMLNNFWTLFLILLLLTRENTYWAGIILAVDVIITDGHISKPLLIFLIGVIFLYNFLAPRKFWKEHYEEKLNRLQKKYNKYERELRKRECPIDLDVEDLDDGL